MKKLLVAIALIFMIGQAHAAVDLPWSTSFDCAEWSYAHGTLACDDLQVMSNSQTTDGNSTGVTVLANRPGSAGSGARFYVGDGTNNNGATLGFYFSSPQPELYFSWWMRYQTGFKWSAVTGLHYDKWLYIVTGGVVQYAIAEPNDTTGMRIGTSTVGAKYPKNASWGWPQIYGDVSSGSCDGHWLRVEVYLKMDTNQDDGIGKMWVGNNLIMERYDCDWSGGDATARLGWVRFWFKSNQNLPDNGGDRWVDYDDFYVGTYRPNEATDDVAIQSGRKSMSLGGGRKTIGLGRRGTE